eukprot:7202627-Prymnesium_polylepis.1
MSRFERVDKPHSQPAAMSANHALPIGLVLVLLPSARSFDASKFRTECTDSAFCRAGRPPAGTRPAFELDEAAADAEFSATGAAFSVWQPQFGRNSTLRLLLRPTAGVAAEAPGPVAWHVVLLGGAGNTLRASSLALPSAAVTPDIVVQHAVLDGGALHPPAWAFRVMRVERNGFWSELRVRLKPLRIDLHAGEAAAARPSDDVALASFNGRGLLRFAASDASCNGRPEHWRGFVDSRPHGCTAVGADITFPDVRRAREREKERAREKRGSRARREGERAGAGERRRAHAREMGRARTAARVRDCRPCARA